MKLQRFPLFTLIVVALCCAACDSASTNSTEKNVPAAASSNAPASTANNDAGAARPKPDYAAIAQKLVAQCAGVKEGEIVQISGDVKDDELLRELMIAVRKQGAFPLVEMHKQDAVWEKKAMAELPAKWDTQTDQLRLKLAGLVNASIGLVNSEPFNPMEDVPQERLAALQKANEPIQELRRQRNIRSIFLGGNGLYPSKANATRHNLTQAELAKIFWDGVNIDYTQLQSDGEKYRQMLAVAKEVHLTHPNGTDLKVKVEKRPVFVSDGVISEEDKKRGGPATTLWLPAGEVYVTTVPGTAEGRVVVERDWFTSVEGLTLLEGLTLEFKAGKLVSMTARAGLEPLKKAYDKVTGEGAKGKDEFGFIDLGINRSIVLGPQTKSGDYPPAGMVAVGFGGNRQYGGENKSLWGYELTLPGTTLKLDGKVVVENGALK